jgi:hypothetical protein
VARGYACLGGRDHRELARLELVDVLEYSRQTLAELRRALPGADGVDAPPGRPIADEGS